MIRKGVRTHVPPPLDPPLLDREMKKKFPRESLFNQHGRGIKRWLECSAFLSSSISFCTIKGGHMNPGKQKTDSSLKVRRRPLSWSGQRIGPSWGFISCFWLASIGGRVKKMENIRYNTFSNPHCVVWITRNVPHSLHFPLRKNLFYILLPLSDPRGFPYFYL